METELPIFGKISLEEVEDSEYRFEASIWSYDFQGTPIDLTVHFKEAAQRSVSKVSLALNTLSKILLIGQKALQQDFEEDEIVKEYIEEWNEDIFLQLLSEEEFERFIEKSDKAKSIQERLLSLLRIVRIGIYAESENSFITMDFAFGYEQEKGFRDDMLVVTLNPQLKVTNICTEG